VIPQQLVRSRRSYAIEREMSVHNSLPTTDVTCLALQISNTTDGRAGVINLGVKVG
jgi:hypothetical protein